jgi:hypothetical protein
MCVCGHHRTVHDYHEGCIAFLCCERIRHLTPGSRHTEHDGVNHLAQHCPCQRFTEGNE